MAVIIYSTHFPAKHLYHGEQTFFVPKIWKSFADESYVLPSSFQKYIDDYTKMFSGKKPIDLMSIYFESEPKYHTIRAGNRWRVGDIFSPRIWTGRPYASKQFEFAPPITIKKIFDIYINLWQTSPVLILNGKNQDYKTLELLAKNDGLSETDFVEWFKIHPKSKDGFTGQVICWNENIQY